MNSIPNDPSPGTDQSSQPQRRRSEPETRTTNRVIIFTILFGVTGALGLPLLWWSKSFTRSEKLVWSLITLLYTFILIAGTALICWWALRQIFPNGIPGFPG